MLFGDLPEGAELVETGIGDQHVDAAGFLLHRGIDPVDVGELRCVALDRGGVAANRGDRLLKLGLPATGDEHLCALLGEALGDAKADARTAARYEGDLASKLPAHDAILQPRGSGRRSPLRQKPGRRRDCI